MATDGQPEEILTILFADVVDSSRLYSTYGDAGARRIVGACMDTLAQVVGEQAGTVIKTIGDEIMCTFPSADQGVLAAVTMQQRVEEKARIGALHNSLSLRIGLHRGAVVRENHDVYGDAVNLAARMAALSKAHQIMTTRQTVDALEGETRTLARFVDQSTIKGQSGAFDLYEIVWSTSEATMAASGVGPRTLPRTEQHLDVALGDKTWTVCLDKPCVTLGRSTQCDIAIEDTRASRLHAKIEFAKDRFILRDVSTNGTHVQLESSGAHHVRRDELAIDGNGLVALGRPVQPDSPLCLRLTLRREVPRL